MSITEGIWERTGASTMSRSGFIRAVAFFTLVVGLFVALGAVVTYHWQANLLLLLGSFIVSIACIFVFTGSDNPAVSFLGVGGMSLALGAMIGPLIAMFSSVVVMQAIVTTAAIMVVMSAVGILFPFVFRSWGPYVLGALTGLIVIQFAQILFISLGYPEAAHWNWITWAGIALFTGIVAFDWSRSLDMPYTLDNAIDASGGLILDAVNLFIRLLQIYAQSQGSSRSSSRSSW